jgi:aryl sulfotransferase
LSLFEHHSGYSDWLYSALSRRNPSFCRPFPRQTLDFRTYFDRWLEEDGVPYHSFWDVIQSWWNVRKLPNVKLVHYNDLSRNFASQARSIATFLGAKIPPEDWQEIGTRCSFSYMKKNSHTLSSKLDILFADGGQQFINRGIVGRWRRVLDDADSAKYERYASENLTASCARWLIHGAGSE